ncbi:MAG: PEP-CTERM sorting domain-containing protein [Gemmatimonadaceae bacterium]|nr:PEP-CTERM sorting domain-containing protein [Gemmatimonadaceae bacterium]
MRRTALLLASSLVLGVQPVLAFPIAPVGTECRLVIAGGSAPVVATYLGNSATFSNNLFLMLTAGGTPGDDGDKTNDLFIFNNQTSAVNSQVTLGSFASGTELIFRLEVTNTGNNYFSGPSSRNADGKCHARVQNEYAPGTTLVSFEDLENTPEGDSGYNDLSFSFTNTVSSAVVPEPATNALLLVGLVALCRVRRRRTPADVPLP